MTGSFRTLANAAIRYSSSSFLWAIKKGGPNDSVRLDEIEMMVSLFQTFENSLDGVEVGKILWSGSLLGVFDGAFLIDDEGSAC